LPLPFGQAGDPVIQVAPPDTLGRRMHRAMRLSCLMAVRTAFPGDPALSFSSLRMTLFRAWSGT
ncbi:MAG: hypothetical protein WAX51_06705, partial [Bifidobacterium adolescentis]